MAVGLLERDAALSSIETLVGRAATGAGGVIVLEAAAGMGKTLAAMTADNPVLLIVDDVHRCDRESMAWIGFAVRRLRVAADRAARRARTQRRPQDPDGRETTLILSASWQVSALLLAAGLSVFKPCIRRARRRVGDQARAGASANVTPVRCSESSQRRRAVSASCAAALRLAGAGWPRCS
jgi:hypothetical protein